MSGRITIADLDAVLEFWGMFEGDEPIYTIDEPVMWEEDGKTFVNIDPYTYSERFRGFMRAVHERGLVMPIDWPSWQEVALRYFRHPELLETAGLDVVARILTTHVRKGRFCSGHLAHMIDSGHLGAVMERLRAIRDVMEVKGEEAYEFPVPGDPGSLPS